MRVGLRGEIFSKQRIVDALALDNVLDIPAGVVALATEGEVYEFYNLRVVGLDCMDE